VKCKGTQLRPRSVSEKEDVFGSTHPFQKDFFVLLVAPLLRPLPIFRAELAATRGQKFSQKRLH
jgi:hypothetical protein